ncbi:Bax inhibitor-1/YccA family protein [Helicobacter bilis]|uniref:Bax inhibitor-1/YccA family protein n=1 Tax=Helicobacter bilis TaxID=37372 RepID=A0A4U8U5G8_9HELI|nr:Bax inhibitor-1/YccA family protein [Helicobacter bilis]MCI7410834.1 Bax inhibitor-1/YccA family protein [Helicobacter bilis]MDD7297034.1 Bax inhibitor-1/YccA family protein [Helicobacter bilis]MDY4400663.1 Bax inhibitor-1/YccA family protein [Helicobacter bilis]TLE07436.1 Bax inhibitor-1/YccA family protein [Helicobacter bilis]TLE08791.1 Bax inhibitor-1/YccA family protein [Helicobacter bilis]
MGIYDRNYTQNTQEVDYQSSYSDAALVNFVRTTYKFFAGSLLLATIGALVGMANFEVVMQYRMPILIVELALIFGLGFVQDKPGINLAVFAAFAFISGLALAPLLTFVMIKNPAIVAQALAMTTIIFGIMSIFALKTKKDLANMGTALFWSVLVIFVFSLLNMFVFKSPMFQFAIASAVVLIFSLYIAYDTQNIVRGRYDNPIMAAISLYLDVLNIFTALLQILGLSNKD